MEVHKTKQVGGSRYLRLFERSFSHKDHNGKWLFASRDEEPPTHEEKKPDAVIVVAVKNDEYRPKIVLVSEYRVPIMAREISFPAGLIDPQDYKDANTFAGVAHEEHTGNRLIEVAAKRAAIRECYEETNLTFQPLSVSPPNLYSSAGLTNESCVFVMGTAHGEPSSKNSEKSEDIEVLILDEDQISALLNGKPPYHSHALSVRAWTMLLPITQFMGLNKLVDQ